MKEMPLKSIKWQPLTEWVDARPGRERLLMLGTFMILLYSFIAYSLIPYLQARQGQTSRAVDTYLSQIVRRSQDIYQESHALKENTDFASAKKINDLAQRIRNFDPRLNEISESIIEPKEMLPFIKNLIDEQHLRIRQIENDPPEPVTQQNKDSETIYKHGIYLVASGNYVDHIRFLKKLEKMSPHFFWDSLQLDVDEDGSTTVGLEIYTLNFKSDWLEI